MKPADNKAATGTVTTQAEIIFLKKKTKLHCVRMKLEHFRSKWRYLVDEYDKQA